MYILETFGFEDPIIYKRSGNLWVTSPFINYKFKITL